MIFLNTEFSSKVDGVISQWFSRMTPPRLTIIGPKVTKDTPLIGVKTDQTTKTST